MKAMLRTWLGSRRLYIALLLLNTLMVLAMLWGMRNERGGDFRSYMALSEGLRHGSYSMWWMLSPPIPDTFRTPGYPLYIALFVSVFKNWKVLKLVQAVMYGLSVHLSLKLVDRFNGGLAAKNIFLVLLLLSPNVAYYISLMSPEIPVILCLSLLLIGDPLWKKPTWLAAIGIGALWGFVFQCRPVFLFFPFVRVACDLLFARRTTPWAKTAVMLVTFVATLIPYGLWNKEHHGRFSLTPLEGGGGVMHTGHWAGRIPNYKELHYWGNFTGDEMLLFVPRDSVPGNIAAFEREWTDIETQLQPLLTHQDSLMLLMCRIGMPYSIQTYNTTYTLERERLLKERMMQHVKEHPGYTVKYKLYSAFRLWIAVVPHDAFAASGTVGKLKYIAQFVLSLAIFLGAVIAIFLAHRRGLLQLKRTYPMLLLLLYFWAIHIPFAIQTRYTVPVRMVLYVYMAVAIAALMQHKRKPA